MRTLLIYLMLGAVLEAGVSQKTPDLAKRLGEEVLLMEAVTIEYYSDDGRKVVTFSDPVWLRRLATVLEDAPYYLPQAHCLCISYPIIHLQRKGVRMGTLSMHHGTKLRAYLGAASGDFSVGETTCRAVAALAREKATGETKE